MSEVIKELRVKNWEAYKDETIPFSAGLVTIRGRNSTGKSSILDAITYSLFGDVPGVKVSALVSRLPGANGMKTLVKFKPLQTGNEAQLLRVGGLGHKGEFKTEDKKLVVDSKEVTIEGEDELKTKVADLLGVSLRKFQSLVYVRQGGMTSILNPNREQMDSLLQITLLRELREQFDAVRKQYEKWDNNDVTTLISNLESMMSEKRNELQHVLDDAKLLETEVDGLVTVIKRSESPELVELVKRIDDRERLQRDADSLSIKAEETLKAAGVADLQALAAKLDGVSSEYAERKRKKAEVEARMAVDMDAWAGVRGQVESVRAEIANHEKMLKEGVSKCPECGQPISPARIRELMQEASPRLEALSQKEAEAKAKYEADRQLAESLNDAAKYEYVIGELRSQKERYEAYASNVNGLNESVLSLTGAIAAALQTLGLSIDPQDKSLKLKVAQNLPIGADDLNSKKALLAAREKQLAEKRSYKGAVKQWIDQSEGRHTMLKARLAKASVAKNFSVQFDTAIETRRKDLLASIEYKAMEYYKRLTDQQVYDAFIVDPEDYEVYVHPIGLTERIPATRVGGGHQTLIALSIRLALMDITQCKRLLLLDEPTDGVDSENMPQLAGYLGELPKFIDQIIMVTHHNICEESSASVIQVYADKDGSHIKVS
ncbi:MAG: AAA family ATPase [Nitrososphaerota archaeon]|jgi:DNA repair exonuclease SbcCD ATPase subunit|nr:AAA family ATPase [Nitrososphaerota archaeon]MDG6948771.1 AAA family ATPase [Nitrososphaerota archaeon]